MNYFDEMFKHQSQSQANNAKTDAKSTANGTQTLPTTDVDVKSQPAQDIKKQSDNKSGRGLSFVICHVLRMGGCVCAVVVCKDVCACVVVCVCVQGCVCV